MGLAEVLIPGIDLEKHREGRWPFSWSSSFSQAGILRRSDLQRPLHGCHRGKATLPPEGGLASLFCRHQCCPLLFNQFHPGILSTDHFPPSATAAVLQQQGMPQGHVETTRDLKKHQDS